MLGHARVQRHIVVLRPTAQWRQPEHGLLVALRLQLRGGILHQEGMAVVHRVAQLEDEDRISTNLLELSLQLQGREAVLVHAIIVLYLLQHLDLSTNKPIARLHDQVNVGVIGVRDAKGPPSALLLHVLIDCGGRHDGNYVTGRCSECNFRLPFDLSLLVRGARLDDGYRHRGKLAVKDHVLVMSALEILLLRHEAIERACPALSEDVDPLQFLLRQSQLLELLSSLQQRRPLRCRGNEVHQGCGLACQRQGEEGETRSRHCGEVRAFHPWACKT
mmetsp:Transcript_111651/g.249466  ORF Transcript_111651/g.249466 Transcript_111651/m.249466 type:complete len:275 (+) Transcript_111651:583-1407(+)